MVVAQGIIVLALFAALLAMLTVSHETASTRNSTDGLTVLLIMAVCWCVVAFVLYKAGAFSELLKSQEQTPQHQTEYELI